MQGRPWWLLPLAGRVHPLWWAPVLALALVVQHLIGPAFQLPLVFIVPVTMAAWYSGRRAALAFAIAFPIAQVVMRMTAWADSRDPSIVLANAVVLGAIYIFLVLIFGRLAEHERTLQREIRVLEGLLPICAVCKSIRDARGEWQRLEHFIQDRSEAKFSHGLCPQCMNQHYEDSGSQPFVADAAAASVRTEVSSAAERLR